MRVIKYFLLLILLITIGLTVYIFTQKSNYQVTHSQIIKASRYTAYEYLSDYRNWETFSSISIENPGVKFLYGNNTGGKGARFEYKGQSTEGSRQMIYAKDYDSIAEQIVFNGNKAKLYWKLKDTLGGTKITIHTTGKINFITKAKTFLEGGIKSSIKNNLEKDLYHLNKTLKTELTEYNLKVEGVVQRKSLNFIYKKFSCKSKSLTRNIKAIMPTIEHFFKKNNIPMAGSPMVVYDTPTLTAPVVTVSIGIPTLEKVFLQEDSDLQSGTMEGFTCIKTTLTGDYSHRDKLWKKGQEYIQKQNYKPNFAGKYVEFYFKTIEQEKKPSKWVTSLYIPVYPKAAPAGTFRSTTTQGQEQSSGGESTQTLVKPQTPKPTEIEKPTLQNQPVKTNESPKTNGTNPAVTTPKPKPPVKQNTEEINE